MEAPERIWAAGGWDDAPNRWTSGLWDLTEDGGGDVEYVRADLHAARIAELEAELASGSFYKESDLDALQNRIAELEAENERLQEVLQSMDDTIVARSELFISDQECLYNLRDRIRRAAVQGETHDG